MNNQSYLTFHLHNLVFGLETFLVKEIFLLPELIMIPETPGDIIGVLYLRDRLIPVMHLARRLGQPIQPCRLDDEVIIIQWKNFEMGVIVNEVLDVIELDSSKLDPEPNYGRENHINTAFIANIAKFAEKSLIILNPETLIRQPEAIQQCLDSTEVLELTAKKEENSHLLSNFFDLYCPNSTQTEQEILRQRAKDLEKPLETWEAQGKMPLAVFGLGKEYFGCDLALVREFIDIGKITPIPCCPSHIVGNINWRGEIITLVDIRSLLHFTETKQSVTQAILVQIDDISAGIVVDEIYDVLQINQEQLAPNPTGVAAEVKQFFQGMTTFKEHLLSALDLPKIFAEGNLVAD